jgi:hypothetical protein
MAVMGRTKLTVVATRLQYSKSISISLSPLLSSSAETNDSCLKSKGRMFN